MHFVPSPNAGIAQWNFTNGLLVLKTRKALLSVFVCYVFAAALLMLLDAKSDGVRTEMERRAASSALDRTKSHKAQRIQAANGIVFKKHRLASEAQTESSALHQDGLEAPESAMLSMQKMMCNGLPWITMASRQSHATTRNQYIKSYHCNFGVQFLRRVYSGRSLNGAAHPGLILLWLMDAQPPKTSQNNSTKSSTISRWMLL